MRWVEQVDNAINFEGICLTKSFGKKSNYSLQFNLNTS